MTTARSLPLLRVVCSVCSATTQPFLAPLSTQPPRTRSSRCRLSDFSARICSALYATARTSVHLSVRHTGPLRQNMSRQQQKLQQRYQQWQLQQQCRQLYQLLPPSPLLFHSSMQQLSSAAAAAALLLRHLWSRYCQRKQYSAAAPSTAAAAAAETVIAAQRIRGF